MSDNLTVWPFVRVIFASQVPLSRIWKPSSHWLKVNPEFTVTSRVLQ
jgi:hypothetical protein